MSPPLHLLILEDRADDAELMIEELHRAGFTLQCQRVETQADYLAALQALPEVVLADYSLTQFTALEALNLLQKQGYDIPFIVVTGTVSEEAAVECMKKGAADYLLKDRLTRLGPAVAQALEQKRLRDEKRRAVEALRESEERFRLLVENVPSHAIFVVDPEGRIVSWNRGAQGILGYAAEEVIGRKVCPFFPASDGHRVESLDRLRMAAASGPVSEEGWLVRKDGSRFWASGTITALRDGKGDLRGFVKIFGDLTDRKQLEESLRQRAEELADADRRKNEFLALLSHELRNPLSPIVNAVHLLDVPGPGAPVAWARDVINRQVGHLARLIDDLLDVSRITHGKLELRKERIDLARIVQAAQEIARPLMIERRHKLSVSLPSEPIYLDADPVRLEQVLSNLLVNAARYTDPGGRIALTVERSNDEAVLRVRDSGTGIHPIMLKRIFEPFTQVGRPLGSTYQWGLGLGLSLVRSLVELHGGQVAACSAGLGQGSEFVVRLPALVGLGPEPVEAGGATHAPVGLSLKVLLVEDNPDMAESLARVLRLEGHIVETAAEGKSALAAARAHPPNVVLLDIGLPGMDGYEVAQCLRRLPGLEQIPLLALTGFGQEQDRRRSGEVGIAHHLVKPVDPRFLCRLLREVQR